MYLSITSTTSVLFAAGAADVLATDASELCIRAAEASGTHMCVCIYMYTYYTWV